MTAIKVVIIKCNRCGATNPRSEMIIGDMVHIEGGVPGAVVDARHDAISKGWLHAANGEDLCPSCRPVGLTPGKARLLAHIPHPHLPHWGAR